MDNIIYKTYYMKCRIYVKIFKMSELKGVSHSSIYGNNVRKCFLESDFIDGSP